MIFSAAWSRQLSIVAFIQSYHQLDSREGTAIITDNTQLTIAGSLALGNELAVKISKAISVKRRTPTGAPAKAMDRASIALSIVG
ncbi:MAG: hypothetical protein FWH55_14785 [Oscillospiraceae bacterium]|nr:hypothetical protein [Oscillospiraceae bacterium]